MQKRKKSQVGFSLGIEEDGEDQPMRAKLQELLSMVGGVLTSLRINSRGCFQQACSRAKRSSLMKFYIHVWEIVIAISSRRGRHRSVVGWKEAFMLLE